jgi:hypothetical protein
MKALVPFMQVSWLSPFARCAVVSPFKRIISSTEISGYLYCTTSPTYQFRSVWISFPSVLFEFSPLRGPFDAALLGFRESERGSSHDQSDERQFRPVSFLARILISFEAASRARWRRMSMANPERSDRD